MNKQGAGSKCEIEGEVISREVDPDRTAISNQNLQTELPFEKEVVDNTVYEPAVSPIRLCKRHFWESTEVAPAEVAPAEVAPQLSKLWSSLDDRLKSSIPELQMKQALFQNDCKRPVLLIFLSLKVPSVIMQGR